MMNSSAGKRLYGPARTWSGPQFLLCITALFGIVTLVVLYGHGLLTAGGTAQERAARAAERRGPLPGEENPGEPTARWGRGRRIASLPSHSRRREGGAPPTLQKPMP